MGWNLNLRKPFTAFLIFRFRLQWKISHPHKKSEFTENILNYDRLTLKCIDSAAQFLFFAVFWYTDVHYVRKRSPSRPTAVRTCARAMVTSGSSSARSVPSVSRDPTTSPDTWPSTRQRSEWINSQLRWIQSTLNRVPFRGNGLISLWTKWSISRLNRSPKEFCGIHLLWRFHYWRRQPSQSPNHTDVKYPVVMATDLFYFAGTLRARFVGSDL